MNEVYDTQTKLTIELDAESSLEGVTDALIKYRKPDKTLGSWEGVIDDPEPNFVSYTLQVDETLMSGNWVLWLYLTFEDGRILPGKPVVMKVIKEGKLS